MKKALLGLSLLLLAVFVPFIVQGAFFRAGDQVSITPSETLSGDVYAGGGTVVSGGAISGDLYAGGGTVTISGPVGQDAVLAGGNIIVIGRIGDDLRAGGGSITISGEVIGDVVVGGGVISLAGPRIGGGVYAGGGMIRIDTPVSGDVRIDADEVVINAPIGGNVQIEATKITLESKAAINGTLTYRSPKEAIIKEGAVTRGGISYEAKQYRSSKKKAAGFISLALIVKFLAVFIGSLIVGLFFRRYSLTLIEGVFRTPLAEFGRGIAVIILLPVISVILLVTILGIPFGILGIIAFIASIIFVSLLLPIVIGSWLHRKIKKTEVYPLSWKTILLGAAVTFVIGLIPILGGIILAIVFLMTLGVMAKLKWTLAKEWR